MIKEVDAEVVITSRMYARLFSMAVIVVDLLLEIKNQDLPANSILPYAQLDPHKPAYIIYTSGSSGRPKGVSISHAAASHGINHFSLNGKSRWLLFFNPVFSAAQRTILATICKGGCLCLSSRARIATSLPEVIKGMRIDALGVTPSILSTLSPKDISPYLKQITTVGEPLSSAVIEAWADVVELRASFGLSECAQLNCTQILSKGDKPNVFTEPTDTTEFYVLRPDSTDLAELGRPGELCLVGPQLADGYLHRPLETAKSFVVNPFGPGRMYRTGDLVVQYSVDSFEVLGRIDHQIKLHGQRLEPEEIVAVLQQHLGVNIAAVVAASVAGSKALVAAIVPHGSHDWTGLTAEVRDLARQMLPPYMVPSFWLKLERLPLNANGKLNTKELQTYAEQMPVEEMLGHSGRVEAEAEVQDRVEVLIQKVWADILHLDRQRISRTDSFFRLGGSSMQAIRMINELRKQGVDLGSEAIFRHDDLATLRAEAVIQEIVSDIPQTSPAPFSMIHDDVVAASLKATRGVVDAYPATPMQESLVGLTLQGSTLYLYQRAYDCRHLDLIRLKLAFQLVFHKSDILRTTFNATEAGLFEVVRDDICLPWDEVESSSLADFKHIDQQVGVKLGDPFVRITILARKILVVTMHHSLFDFWSSGFLYEDVSRLYCGLDVEPRPQFKNFVRAIARTDWQAAEAFWKEYLSRASPTVLSFAPVSKKSRVVRSVSYDLHQIAASSHVTASTIIYTAWAMVLSQHMSSTDVVFATPLSGREIFIEDALRLEGPTLTIVPRRINLEKNASATETLAVAHQQSLEVLKHSQYGLRRSLKAGGHSAFLFDTMVNILPRQREDAGTLTSDIFPAFGESSGWQTEYTTLEVEQQNGQWEFHLTTEIEELRAEFIIDQFVQAVGWLAKEPKEPLTSLSLLTESEVRMLEATQVFPDDIPQLLHAGFELEARSHPWRIAIQWQDLESFTYKKLDCLSNQLAWFLRGHGLQRGDFACLLMDKSPMMVAAIMATLKLGVAYVPLSPENPIERNSYIADEVKAKIILSESSALQCITWEAAPVVYLDSVDLTSFEMAAVASEVSGNDNAYVIYTSGSAGTPKGVQVSHAAAAAAIDSMVWVEKRRIGHWRSLQFSNYVFDASILDIFNTLNSGGTLCMAPTERLLSDLTRVINEMDVNHSFFTPTVARLLLPEEVPSLKTLTVGGEAVTADISGIWNNHRIIQAYGPTEAAMVSTMRDMSPGDNPRNIGKPLPTVKAFIVQQDGTNLTPYGAIGELCIAGPQLAAGYLKRPDLTTAAFCQTSIGGFHLMYRSGDLARFLPDGELECLGRKDNQVKINGHRIELGEIETTILATGMVLDAISVVANIASKPQLAAFVIFDASEASEIQQPDTYVERVAALRNKLKDLAHYMYPKVLLPLGSMPRMPSGKTDRKLLAEWVNTMDRERLSTFYFDSFGVTFQDHIVPTETREQQLLEQAWMKLLNLPQMSLGQEANFLALGGDSIMAINLTSFTRKHGYHLQVSDVLMHPRLADMAGCMKRSQDTVVEISQATFKTPEKLIEKMIDTGLDSDEVAYTYPCPPGQTEFLLHGAQEEKMWVLMTVRPLDISTDVARWIRAVKQLTETNDILRTTFAEVDGAWIGVVLKKPIVLVDIIDIADDREKAETVNAIWQSDFAFGKPFIRYAVLRHPNHSMELVTKMDHGLYDGTLLRILGAHFRELQHGRPAPEYTPFGDFAFHLWQSDKAASLKFWSSTMRPTGFQFPQIAKPLADKSVIVTSQLNLNDFASACGITVPIAFQAAFQLWLAKRTGQFDVGMDYLYTGRNINMSNPQQINGVCCNFLPLRACAKEGQSVSEYLAQTQSDFWSATENATVGLDEIYAAADLDRATMANRSLFLFQPFEPQPTTAAETKAASVDMRWVYMAGVEITMPQPYGLVCEVRKTTDGYKVKFTFDVRVFTADKATKGAKEVLMILEHMLENKDAEVRGLLSA